jgi:hypothetical protein
MLAAGTRLGPYEVVSPLGADLQAEQGSEALPHFREDFGGHLRLEDYLARLPIEILDVVGEDDANDGAAAREWDLERA